MVPGLISILAQLPETRIIFLTVHDNDEHVIAALKELVGQ